MGKPTVKDPVIEPILNPINTDDVPIKSARLQKWINKNLMLIVTLFGVVMGVILGFYLRPYNLSDDSILLISYPGELFMRMLKLLILPLIISSIVSGSASLNVRINKKIALKTFIYFISTSMLSAIIGVILVMTIKPGVSELRGHDEKTSDGGKPQLMDNIMDLGRNLLPDNLFQASLQTAHTVYVPAKSDSVNPNGFNTENVTQIKPVFVRELEYRSGVNTLGLVFFCLVFGTVLSMIGEKGKVVVDFFTAIFEVMMRTVSTFMWVTPLGAGSIIAGKILSINNLAVVMTQLVWFIITVCIGIFIHQWILLPLIYFLILRKNPYKFYFNLLNPWMTAFATSSSAATLPVTFPCLNEKLRIDPRLTRFVLPIGTSVNTNGTALFLAITSIFIARMAGMDITFGTLVTVILTSTITSMSTASIPSLSLILILVVLSAINAPSQNVSLLFAIDWLLDRLRTTSNVMGNCYAAAIIEKLSRSELRSLDETAEHDHQEQQESKTKIKICMENV